MDMNILSAGRNINGTTAKKGGHAEADGPATKTTLKGSGDAKYTLPKASIIVLRGKIGN